MYLTTAKTMSLFCSVLQFAVPEEISKSKFSTNSGFNLFTVNVSMHSINDIPIDNASLFQIVLYKDNLSTC